MSAFLATIIIGLAGFVLLIADADSYVCLVVSKLIAALLLYTAYKLYRIAEKHGDLDKIKRWFNHEQ